MAAGFTGLAALGGCASSYSVLHPVGPVATSEFHFLLVITGVMMVIIMPTTVMICLFALRYRKSNNAAYDPEFSHSLILELAMWGVPLMVVLVLAYCTYRSVFMVNPAAPLALALNPQSSVAVAPDNGGGTLEVDVITTDWQWIFVYPKQGIATVDDLVVPAGQNVQLQLTSASVVNDIYIPQVLAMIDVMPGMRTVDSFRVDAPGQYEGFSADFSGAGFSWMQFSTRILPRADFDSWVARTQASTDHLTYARFQRLARPTINQGAKPHYFSAVPADLFTQVYNAARAGVDYPVPADVQSKAPFPSPISGKQGELKNSS
jgi:cytochrome o ubiquinol oxidase subunit 2